MDLGTQVTRICTASLIRACCEEKNQSRILDLEIKFINDEGKLFNLENYPLKDHRPYTFDEFNSWNQKGYKAWIDFIFYQKTKKIEVLDQYILRPVMNYKKTKMDLSDHYQIVLKAVIR